MVFLEIDGDARAYPLQILTWHEIVNDEVGGVPVAVTFCPLCNSAIAFDRLFDGVELEFGVSGNLRNSDLIMYDRQTHSWWQQFTGEGIVGEYAGRNSGAGSSVHNFICRLSTGASRWTSAVARNRIQPAIWSQSVCRLRYG